MSSVSSNTKDVMQHHLLNVISPVTPVEPNPELGDSLHVGDSAKILVEMVGASCFAGKGRGTEAATSELPQAIGNNIMCLVFQNLKSDIA